MDGWLLTVILEFWTHFLGSRGLSHSIPGSVQGKGIMEDGGNSGSG